MGAAGNVVLNTGSGNLIDGTQGTRLDGVNAGDWAGAALATGDVNGDGIADIAIGAYNANSYAGAAYIYNGRASGWPNPNFVLGGL